MIIPSLFIVAVTVTLLIGLNSFVYVHAQGVYTNAPDTNNNGSEIPSAESVYQNQSMVLPPS